MDDEKEGKISDLLKSLGMVEDAVELARNWLDSDNQKGARTSLAIATDALSLSRMRVWKVEAVEQYLREQIKRLEAAEEQSSKRKLEELLSNDERNHLRGQIAKLEAQPRELLEVIDEMLEAYGCLNQRMRLSGSVTPSTPGGQLTAFRRDGTPVDRNAFAREVFDRAEALALRHKPPREDQHLDGCGQFGCAKGCPTEGYPIR